MCFNKFWEPVPFWVVPGQEEGRCGGEGRVTTAGRERWGTQTEPWTQVDLAPVPALISPKPTPPLCKRLVTYLIPHPAAFISPSFSL